LDVMDANDFASSLERWLRETGAVDRLRTQLRSDMALALANKRSNVRRPTASAAECAANSLVLEYLCRKGHWYAASVLASEAGQSVAVSAPTGIDIHSQHQSAAPKLSDAELASILAPMDLSHLDSENLRVSYYRQQEKSLLEALLELSNSGPSDSTLARLAEGQERVGRKLERLRRRMDQQQASTASPTPQNSISHDDQREEVCQLRASLNEAKEEARQLRTLCSEREGLREVAETQRETILALKEELKLVKESKVNQDEVPKELIVSQNEVPHDLKGFLSQVRANVDSLYQKSRGIDREFQINEENEGIMN